MGLMRRIADYLDPVVEKRDLEGSMLHAFGPGVGLTNIYPGNPRAAENLSTVLACISAISSGMASLPAYVYRVQENSRSIDNRHPIAALIEAPNQHQTWSDWIEWIMASVLLRGNALSEIIFDNRGAPISLRPIAWESVTVQLLGSGRLVYDVSDGRRRRRLLQAEVFHLKDRSDDGLIGVSRLRRAAAVISTGLSVQDFAGRIYSNGVFPSGAMELDDRLGTDQKERLRTMFEQSFSGSHNGAKALILDQGIKWKSISISPEDAEFLENRRFTSEELARLFGVPPVVVGDLTHGTFTNSETLIRWFAQQTLSPWIRKVEAEFSRSVFSDATRRTHRLEIDLSGLLRGDPQQRWSAWEIAVRNQILTANEIREVEGYNALPG